MVSLPLTQVHPLAQVTATLLTALAGMVPEPLATEQLWPEGWVLTVTLYEAPTATGVAKVKAPLAANARSSALLFCSTRPVPERPLAAPPTV